MDSGNISAMGRDIFVDESIRSPPGALLKRNIEIESGSSGFR